MNIKQIRKAYEDEYNAADYMPTTEKNPESMYQELLAYGKQIKNPYLRQVIEYYLKKTKNLLKSLSTFGSQKRTSRIFRRPFGTYIKCREILRVHGRCISDPQPGSALYGSNVPRYWENERTFPLSDKRLYRRWSASRTYCDRRGNDQRRDQRNTGFSGKLANELKHCVIAHHGELEYGSPKKPALAEAMALHFADCTDAKMQTLTEIFKDKNSKDWLGYNRLFETNLRKTSI